MFEPTADMFPGFDVPPSHAETVGARKARKAREADEAARKSSSANSQSSASVHSIPTTSGISNNASSHKSKEKGFGGWFSRSNKKGVQEISPLPPTAPATVDIPPSVADVVEPELDAEPEIAPAPYTAPLEAPLHAEKYLFPSPPVLPPDKHARPVQSRQGSLVPMPYPPPTSELPPTPGSGYHGIGSPSGT
jgi:hypothetical protein